MTDRGEEYSKFLASLRAERRKLKAERKLQSVPRGSLSETDRDAILRKTNGRCHICGGSIEGAWHADHVLAHSAGGTHHVDNYLPAHTTCNNYRWDYTAAELQEILKLGVWARTQIERRTGVGRDVAEKFATYEVQRRARRKDAGK